ncbi:MAG: PKD domain-containing protein [Solirubrobacteraceae bacterium]
MVIGARLARRTRMLAWELTLGLAVLVGLIAAPGAMAQVTDIHSDAGPLTDIYIGDNLTCQVAHTGNQDFEFFSPSNQAGHCETDVSVGSTDNAQLFQPGNWTPVSQSAVSGDGSARNPFTVTTTVQAVSASSGSPLLTLTQTDTYVVGNEYYRTDMTLTNATDASLPVRLYHAADCYLQGSDSGYGFVDATNHAVACSQTPNDSPPALIEEFAPLTAGSNYHEAYYRDVFSVVSQQVNFPNTCDCENSRDNGMGINWDIANLVPGTPQTFSMLSNFSNSGVTALPISAAGGNSFSGQVGLPVGGTMATFSADSSDSAGDFAATIAWGDGSTSPGAISGANPNFVVSGTHSYSAPGSYTITVTIVRASNTANSGTVTDSAAIAAAASKPLVQGGGSSSSSSTAAGFSGSVNPGGLPTTAYFEYGLDARYTSAGKSGPMYDQRTPDQPVGSDSASHPIAASVSGLVPNALYHVRLVATNSAGTTFGPDVTFTTTKAAAPSQPALGKSFTGAATGLVLIQVNGKLVPLTQLTKIPNGAVINALHGTLTLNTAAPGPTQHATLAAKKGKAKKPKTQTGKFGGAVFKVTQTRSGLATLSLVEGTVKGAPSYATCRTKKGKAVTAAVSKKTLQLLHGSAHGKFRTKGRYSAATIRGTIWTIADRFDGTLVHAIKDTVTVDDLVLHKVISLRPGHSYLAQAHPPKVKKRRTHK